MIMTARDHSDLVWDQKCRRGLVSSLLLTILVLVAGFTYFKVRRLLKELNY